MMRLGFSVASLCWLAALVPAQETANPSIRALQNFDQRVSAYLKLRESVKPKIQGLKPTESVEKIREYQRQFAGELRKARSDAQQGNIFTPEIAAAFRQRISEAMHGKEGEHIRASLRRAAPVRLAALRVNEPYPPGMPLQSVPPSLLSNLPTLPKGLEYGVVDSSLILRDADANVVIDFMENAIP